MTIAHPKYDWVLSNFDNLEAQFKDCLDFIPRIKNNFETISPKFVPIIIESCSLIESIFKYGNKKYKHMKFKEMAREFEKRFQFEECLSLFIDSEVEVLNPFKEWTKKVPTWWQAYNSFKHDRLESIQSATMENALTALCGLHQVISKDLDFVPDLLRRGWIDRNHPDVAELIVARIASAGTKDVQ